MLDRLKEYLGIAGEVGADVEMRLRGAVGGNGCVSDSEIERVYGLSSAYRQKIINIQKPEEELRVVPRAQMVERLGVLGVDAESVREDFEGFYKNLGCGRILAEMGTIESAMDYSLPMPGVSEFYLQELEKAITRGEVDLVMIDDGRVYPDEMTNLVLPVLLDDQSFDMQSITVGGKGIRDRVAKFGSMAEYGMGIEGLNDKEGGKVRLLAFNKQNKVDRSGWKMMDSIRENLPIGPFMEYLDIGTYLRLIIYLKSRKEFKVQGISGEELFRNIFYGSGNGDKGMTPLMVLNHFFRGGIVVAIGHDPETKVYKVRPAPLFEGIMCDGPKRDGIIVPQVLSSAGDAEINLE